MIIPLRYIYCYWLWIWAILYYFNITKISPFITLIISTTFTIYNVLIGPRGKVAPLSLRIAISIIELFFLILIGYKSNKISIKDIIYNILVFIIYLMYIKYNNLGFFEIYFKLLPKTTKNKTIKQYVYDRLYNLLS